jgi:hypothetical protein
MRALALSVTIQRRGDELCPATVQSWLAVRPVAVGVDGAAIDVNAPLFVSLSRRNCGSRAARRSSGMERGVRSERRHGSRCDDA